MQKRPGQDREPRTPLSRERILRAAIAVADEKGIDSLTMRELGQRLGVEAMSLYNHVAGKDDLLDGMVDVVVEKIALPSNARDWKEAMRLRAVSARAVFSSHPWASVLIDSRLSSGTARLHYFDWVLGTLRNAGFSLQAAARAFSLVDSYVYGFSRQQASFATPDDVPPQETAEAFLQAIPSDEYPYLREMIVDHVMVAGYDESTDFEFGLDLILEGLERLLEREAK